MKIIVLDGKSHSGKTTTLTDVFYQIAPKGTPKIRGNSNKDFEAVFSYKNKKIALCTGGDTIKYIGDSIKKYAQQKIDVLIIARNNEKKNSPGEFFLADEIQIVHKTKNNQKDAQAIINKI